MKIRWNQIAKANDQYVCLVFLSIALFSSVLILGVRPAAGTCYLSPCSTAMNSGSCCQGWGGGSCPCCASGTGCTCSVQCYSAFCPQNCLTQCGAYGTGTCGQKIVIPSSIAKDCAGPDCSTGASNACNPTEINPGILCFEEYQCIPSDQPASDADLQCDCPCTVDGSDDTCMICASPWGGPPLIVSITHTSACAICPTN